MTELNLTQLPLEIVAEISKYLGYSGRKVLSDLFGKQYPYLSRLAVMEGIKAFVPYLNELAIQPPSPVPTFKLRSNKELIEICMQNGKKLSFKRAYPRKHRFYYPEQSYTESKSRFRITKNLKRNEKWTLSQFITYCTDSINVEYIEVHPFNNPKHTKVIHYDAFPQRYRPKCLPWSII